MFSLDGDRSVTQASCKHCGRDYRRIVGFVLNGGDAYAIYRAALHRHDDANESWLDVTMDSDWEDPAQTHRVSFGCRVGRFGNPEPAASLVPAGLAYSDPGTFGLRLNRGEALAHPRIGDFWAVVDWVLVNDLDVERHTYA